MANFNLTSGKTVAELKNEFNEAFGSKLKVYNKNKIADDTTTLGELGLKADTVFECRSSRTAGSFIAAFLELGLKVKIFTKDEWVAVLPGLTLEATGKVKNNATTDDMKGMEGYQREGNKEEADKSETNDNVSPVACITSLLEEYGIRDLIDNWCITFMNENMEVLDEDAVTNLKDGLVVYLKSVLYETQDGTTKLSDEFDLDVDKQGIVTVSDYNFPGEGETTVEYVEKTLGGILTYAKIKGVNAVVCMHLMGSHYGNEISAFECAAIVNDIPSCFEFIAYEQENEDGDFEYVDGNDNVYSSDQIVEILNDICYENFEEWPPFDAEDGEITDLGEEQKSLFYDLVEKTVFPNN